MRNYINRNNYHIQSMENNSIRKFFFAENTESMHSSHFTVKNYGIITWVFKVMVKFFLTELKRQYSTPNKAKYEDYI